MFNTLKIYKRKELSLKQVITKLVTLGYCRVEAVSEEGDFTLRGDTLELYPVNFNFPLRVEWEFEIITKIYSFDKAINRKIIDYDLLIIIPHLKKSKRYTSEDFPLEVALQIKKGDYVVHSRYGIGRFCGTKRLTIREKEDYYFEIEYDKGDKLYISKEDAHLVQKYAGFSLRRPRLSRLGSKEWTRIKEKVQNGIKSFALEILKMEAHRKIVGGFRYIPDGDWQRKFEDSFPYKETEGQIESTIEVKADMQEAGCMDRIICGDVGYGKTEVAMRAAFKGVESGKQVAFLVPTTILAYQHYNALVKRLKDFPFCVEMLSRFRTKHEQNEILRKLSEGKVDIIVGTHRLLSDDICFKDLGLLIIDEEHKFGVTHKEKIKKLKVDIDILVLTATPIPRTLYMGLVGLKKISMIRTPPKERLAVKTRVIEYNVKNLGEIIVKELRRGGQVFFVHNRIESIEGIKQVLVKVLPKEIRIGLVHGRLPTQAMEKVIMDFINQKIDCLFSTAIVESGIDVPTANTIIINDAHKFGLADLHQLRGRVGRFNLQAFAYLVTPRAREIPQDAAKRLQHLCDFSHLGAGFEVAMTDLELRGAGNILGKEQHGFVWMVGFDLYCRLLKKEIEYLKLAFKIEDNA